MLHEEHILNLNAQDLLADVVGFETDEVARIAQGAAVRTYSGAEYIDFTGGIAVHACGHNHPEVAAAIARQAGEVMHVSDTMRHAPQLELAHWMRALFARLLPGDPWTFLYMNSGSESIDAAAKLALKATGRRKLIAFNGAFHGRTLFATALSRSKTLHWSAYEGIVSALRADIHHVPAPRCAACRHSIRKPAACCLEGVQNVLQQYPEQVAAVFMEAQQGEGGYFPWEPDAAQRLRAITREHGVLLAVDEIQSGCGRTGRWFAFDHLGIDPDIVVFGKAVGGGLPLAGVAARQPLMARWQPGEHGTTFGGNPVACAAGLAALRIIERDSLVERAAVQGERIQARLRPLIGHHGVVDVRGRGLMIGVELRDGAGAPDWGRCTAVKNLCRENGLLVMTCGAR